MSISAVRTRRELAGAGSLCAVLAVALGLGWSSPVRADSMDRELQVQAKKLVTYLKENGYHNVGVLRFRTQLPGQQRSSFAGGALNVNMAERLETALVLSIAPEDKIR